MIRYTTIAFRQVMIHSGLCPIDPHKYIWDSGTVEEDRSLTTSMQ